mgnify:CR=1 FL=1
MKKVSIKNLKLVKETISSLKEENIKGGVSGMCTSSVHPECYFACATAPQTDCEC